MTPDASLLTFRFADPLWLGLALLALVVLLWRPKRGGASFSGFALAKEALRPSRGPAFHRLLVAAGFALLAVALARPQAGRAIIEREQAGRDLQLVIDLSGSMQVDDLLDEQNQRMDRLAGVMQAAKRFVSNRPNDRIGLVFFGDRALTSCPLTYDHETVVQFIERTERQQRALWNAGHEKGLLGNATNLGLGLGAALRGVKDPKSKGRAIILITDGADSRELPSWVDPVEAARHAHSTGVKVYGIGVGDANGTRSERDPFTGRVRTGRVALCCQALGQGGIVHEAELCAPRASDQDCPIRELDVDGLSRRGLGDLGKGRAAPFVELGGRPTAADDSPTAAGMPCPLYVSRHQIQPSRCQSYQKM